MHDFWPSCGYHLLRPTSAGRLAVSDDFLRAYLQRPELAPVAESCPRECELHQALMREPRRTVPEEAIGALADPDARENYRVLLRFRERLLAAPDLESCYFGIFQDASVTVPPLFVNQLTQIFLRAMLEGCDDALQARAAELLFRPQKINLEQGRILAADQETVEMHAVSGGFGSIGELLVKGSTPVRTVELDVLSPETADAYWTRDERFDTVLPLGPSQPGSQALARVLEKWVARFHQVEVSITVLPRVEDERWTWHVGLDSEATALLNDLFKAEPVGEERMGRLLGLFRLEFKDPADMLAQVAGRPVYLGMAMTADRVLRMKPQNLLVNLPLARRT